jgi:hypothetical protein
MENFESLKRELVEFTPERFNSVYRTLVDVAQTSDREYEVLDALSLITDCDLILQQVNETLKNLSDETHCQHCDDKEKMLELRNETIEMKNETIGLLKEELEKYKEKCRKLTDENLRLYKELETNEKVINAQHNVIFGKNNNLKVCEKEV